MRRFSIVMVILGLVATGCSKSTPSATQSTPSSIDSVMTTPGQSAMAIPTALTQPFNNKGTKNVASLTKLTIHADNDGSVFYFEPSILIGKPGEKLKLTITNTGNAPHNFTLASQGINADIAKPGKSVTVTVAFPKSGSLEFHCEYHEKSGMKGAVEVPA